MISHPNKRPTRPVSTSHPSFSTSTVYTAVDFEGYTLQHLKAMYPTRWQEAAFHFGISPTISVEPQISQIKQTAIQQQVWDFYPTPKEIILKMLEVTQLDSQHLVLEPSAGCGDLASAISNFGVNKIDCFELNPLLQKALKLQDFNLIGADFLASSPEPIYDRILANPPFGNNGVARHTQHAFKFLKPGGKLVTLAHHYQLKPSHSDRNFFDWLKSVKARFLNLDRAFAESDRPTSIPIQLIAIDKPA